MNKFISSLAAIALVIASVVISPVTAAGISFTIASANRQNFTLDLPAGVDLEAGDVITLTLRTASNGTAVDLSGNQVTSATLGAGTAETLTNAGNAAGTIVITENGQDELADADLVFVLTSALANDTAYTITYSDTDSNFGAAFINFGTANQVSVSATVVPILTMSLANGTDGNQAIAFGTLTPGAFSEDDIQVNYATNGVGGITSTMAAGGFTTDVDADGTRDNANDREIGVQSLRATTDSTATDYYKVSTAGGTGAVTFDAVDNAITAAGGRDMRTSQNVATQTAPFSGNQMVTIGTQVANTTEAGSYSDTLTFTVTPTF
ncbi:MAG: hypothetical protein AAB779_00975 [Patescibacteria group bacterium]